MAFYCLILIALLHSIIQSHVDSVEPYDLPVLPPDLERPFSIHTPVEQYEFLDINSTVRHHIPRNVWFAVKNKSDEQPKHIHDFIQRNSNWKIIVAGNEEKDEFMEKYYANTSLLWAYRTLNPEIGCSRPEIWRLAVLYKFGGVYMDDDSNIKTKFDDIILPTDRFIVGKEPYNFDDRCYVSSYPISNDSMNLRFGVDRNRQDLLGGKFFFNWAIFSAPRHVIVHRVFQHIVRLIRAEYLVESFIKMSPSDHRGKLLMCASTFPITHAARELYLENDNNYTAIGLRIGGKYFEEYGGQLKVFYRDWTKSHWVNVINKVRAPYLLSYAKSTAARFEGKLIQGPGQKEIFIVLNGTRHAIAWKTFLACGFDTDNVTAIHHGALASIPLGHKLPEHARPKLIP